MEGRWERRADARRRAITAIHSMVGMRLDPNRENRSGPSQPLRRSTFPLLGVSGLPDTIVTQLYIGSYGGAPLYEVVYT